ncbi:MAG: SCP2 domain-containing protein [Betaproteobacteria bacterium]
MLQDFAASAVIRALNHLAERESWARATLKPFAGRSAQFEAPPFLLVLGIDAEGRFAPAGGAPDVTVSIDPLQVPAALLDPKAMMRNVRLSGDAEFAQALSQVLQRLRPEPEDELARFVGDAAAVRIVGLLRGALAQAREGGQRLAASTVDYFVTENPMLVARGEVERFTQTIHQLRDAVERLEKRLQQLEARR